MAGSVARLGMEIAAALEDKWEQGRAEHRGSEGEAFQGEHPIIELHDEALDALLYIWVASKSGELNEQMIHELREQAMGLLLGARAAARIIGILA